jgi:hypothetical protein
LSRVAAEGRGFKSLRESWTKRELKNQNKGEEPIQRVHTMLGRLVGVRRAGKRKNG